LTTVSSKKPQRLTKSLVLENAMCDELSEVQTLILRDQGLEIFDDTRGKDGVLMQDLFNIECLILSKNRINDLLGINQLTSLVELNLSFNNISHLK
jgi:Leucine-rich repeat (LRR) protein